MASQDFKAYEGVRKETEDLVNKKRTFDKKKHGLFIMPKYRSVDINDLSEVKLVESLLKIK